MIEFDVRHLQVLLGLMRELGQGLQVDPRSTLYHASFRSTFDTVGTESRACDAAEALRTMEIYATCVVSYPELEQRYRGQ